MKIMSIHNKQNKSEIEKIRNLVFWKNITIYAS